MWLILTHENADFDAVASQLAAHKLYPAGTPLLSRRVNRNVMQFLALYWDALPYMRPANWRRQHVEQVVLVDTQAVPSVRGVRDKTLVTIIDHHTRSADLPAGNHHIEPLGAATTLGVEMLQAAGLALTPVEATLLLLGIYEDTGALTYDATTPRDIRAAAWLLEQDAQLSVVRRFLDIPLSAAQQALYRKLQLAAEWVRLEGQAILLAAAEADPEFEDEISAVVHRMRDALAPAGLIVLVGLRQHVQLVARSTTDQVDVAVLARALGGGGHGRAAAATIMEMSLTAAVRKVRELLPQAVKPMTRVSDLMSWGVQTIATTATVLDAHQQMQRFGHEGYPVINPESGRLVGLLTRRAVDRAMSHELQNLPIERIMKSGRITVRPEDSIERVQQLMIDEDWGQIPVVAEDPAGEDNPDHLLGIVTRTDLLRLLSRPLPDADMAGMRQRMAQYLPAALWQGVRVISQVAGEVNMPIYFVGGLVRDLLLNKPSVDTDIVVEGDAIALARQLQGQYGGRVRSHARFGTAKWLLSPAVWQKLAPDLPRPENADAFDFVTARTEFYTEPSALPEVAQGSIKLDLHRRDFTINTLAMRLDGAHLGELLDFYGGMRDLTQGIIRVLHSLSFIDDPTRILRAIRLEQRLGFTIEPRTVELMADGLAMLERVTGDRIRHEIELALQEASPVPVMQRLAELGVMAQIHPNLTWETAMADAFCRLDGLLADALWHEALQNQSPLPAYFAIWLLPLPGPAQQAVMTRLKVRKTTRDEVLGAGALWLALQAFPAGARPSQVAKAVRPYAPRPRILLAVRAVVGSSPAGLFLDQYWQNWRHISTYLSGHDLRQMGLRPGPQFALLLDQLLAARLDGEISDEAGERALLARLLGASSG